MNSHYYTLITGASQGFGRALAIECARRKMNLVLVSLPGEELHKLAAFIKSTYFVEVVCFEKDLSKDKSCLEIYQEIKAIDLPINMLINNAGIGSTCLFEDGSPEQYEKQIKLNVLATTMLTHLFLEILKKNSPSYILNVGSLASFFSLPKKQVYGATKSFVYYFSKSLRKELSKDRVYVSVVCPGGMYTNETVSLTIQSGNYLSRQSSMNPEQVVPAALEGLFHKKEVIVPGMLNKCFLLLDNLLPVFIKTFLLNSTMKRIGAKKKPATLSAGQDSFGQLASIYQPAAIASHA